MDFGAAEAGGRAGGKRAGADATMCASAPASRWAAGNVWTGGSVARTAGRAGGAEAAGGVKEPFTLWFTG